MKLISHRGNINGKNVLENNPNYILNCLDMGYECEIDVRLENDKWVLGHDFPQYEIDEKFLNIPGLWLHAKNIITFHELLNLNLNCFFHETDQCTLTSKGFIWTYPGCTLGIKGKINNSICVLPELYPYLEEFNCIGICSDYIENYKKYNK
jgi:hypothetical protein